MSKTKKIILLVSMVVVLAVAAYLNIVLLSPKPSESNPGEVQSTSTFFNTCRDDRDAARKEEIANLDAIINVEGDEYELARANAVAQKQNIVKAMEMEMLLENLLKAKGFDDVVVSVGTTSDSVNVIVAANGLTRENTAVIYKTVATETGYEADYIRILPI